MMKKFLMLLMGILLLSGCGNKEKLSEKEEEKVKATEERLQKLTDEYAEKIGEKANEITEKTSDMQSIGAINSYYSEQEEYYRNELIDYCKKLSKSNLDFDKLNDLTTNYEKFAKLHYVSNKMFWEELAKASNSDYTNLSESQDKTYSYTENYIQDIKDSITELKTNKIDINTFKENVRIAFISMGYITDKDWK